MSDYELIMIIVHFAMPVIAILTLRDKKDNCPTLAGLTVIL